jgi:hypothetical protein
MVNMNASYDANLVGMGGGVGAFGGGMGLGM